MLDYDAYYKAVNGKVNDVFYYYREQAALKAKASCNTFKASSLRPTRILTTASSAR